MARAEELRTQGIENPDHYAIFMELYGNAKKRMKISSTGQAKSTHSSSATTSSASVGTTNIEPIKIDELFEQKAREAREQVANEMELKLQEEIAKVYAESDKQRAALMEEMKSLNEQCQQIIGQK